MPKPESAGMVQEERGNGAGRVQEWCGKSAGGCRKSAGGCRKSAGMVREECRENAERGDAINGGRAGEQQHFSDSPSGYR